MIPQRWIEGYLNFLLKNRFASVLVIFGLTAWFGWACFNIRLHTDFFDFYPRNHEYIRFYNEFRRMFGSANIMSIIVETKSGDIYNPETLQKLDRITKYMVATKGVVPTQILSIAHPKVRSFSAAQGTISIREIFYPTVPQTQADAERVRFAVYSNRGVRGVYVSHDDKAAVVHTGFWEEALDFRYLSERIKTLVEKETDANHKIYVTGFPWLYTCVLEYAEDLYSVFALTFASLSFLLYSYFRTWTGIWVPIFSAILSSIWGIGIAALLGFNLDPLVLVIPIFLTARTISHSVQSMDRYHEEYWRLKDKEQAIIVSYSHLFAPAIAAIVTDGIGLLIVAVAPIPLIQKIALFASFWVISIFISVVTLHPIILGYTSPPPEHQDTKRELTGMGVLPGTAVLLAGTAAAMYLHYGVGFHIVTAFLIWSPVFCWYWLRYCDVVYQWITQLTLDASEGWRRWIIIVTTVMMYVGFPIWGFSLKVGNMTPGAALLFADHPYNVAYEKLNSLFLGASQLIVVVDTMHPSGVKEFEPLSTMEELGDHMEGAQGAGASITVLEIVKRLASLYHDGDPKWGIVPSKPRDIAELFYFFENAAAAGDLDRFMDSSGRYGSVMTLFREYSHEVIMGAIDRAKEFGAAHEQADGGIRFRYAGGLFGILAAVNEVVDGSYWTSLILIFLVIYWCLYLTYGSLYMSLILMLPVVLSQWAAEAMMVWFHIDMNVNSLPVAAAGAGAGVDYGIYHFSRMIDTYDEVGDVDIAIDYATATTGKAIIFTATTMVAGTIFWWFSDLKFQAEMGFLLAMLMMFNTYGGLVVVPAFIKVLRPSFLARRRPRHLRPELKELFKNGVKVKDIEQTHIIV